MKVKKIKNKSYVINEKIEKNFYYPFSININKVRLLFFIISIKQVYKFHVLKID